MVCGTRVVVASPVGNKKEEADAPARQWVDSARSTGIGVCFLYLLLPMNILAD